MGEACSIWLARDFGGMGHDERMDALAGMQRARAALDAEQVRLLAAVQDDPLPNEDGSSAGDKEWAREEVALILRLSSGTARAMLLEARDLVTRFPATLALLERGGLTLRHACRLVQDCIPLADQVAAAVEQRVLARAADQSLSQFGASVRRAVSALAPKRADERLQSAREQRRAVFMPRPGGSTDLWACGFAAADALAMQAAIRERASQWRTANPDDARTHDQREADALAALVLGADAEDAVGGPVSVKPVVNVTVALSTLLAVDEQPGELDGHGPIPAALARALAFDPTGTWRRLLTDPNNRLVDVTAHTYRPPVNMARLVKLQHPTCCFPGCRRRASRDDIDHLLDWQYGGTTTPSNLQPLCTRHHHVKHEAGWTVTREPDGTTIWSSPTGHTYTRPPDQLPQDRTSDPPNEVGAAPDQRMIQSGTKD
jgi:hypothetical protein